MFRGLVRTQPELEVFGRAGEVVVGGTEIRGMKTEEGQDGCRDAGRCCKRQL